MWAVDLERWMPPLYGGGFWPAFAQLLAFYYGAGCLLHFVVPSCIPVKNIQKSERASCDVLRDAVYSLGASIWGQAVCALGIAQAPPGICERPTACPGLRPCNLIGMLHWLMPVCLPECVEWCRANSCQSRRLDRMRAVVQTWVHITV